MRSVRMRDARDRVTPKGVGLGWAVGVAPFAVGRRDARGTATPKGVGPGWAVGVVAFATILAAASVLAETPPLGVPAAAGSVLAQGATQQSRYWLGPDGKPLPFRDDEQIKEFLRTAEVVDREGIEVGSTDPLRVTLDKDGVRADAVFRHFDRVYPRARLRDGRLYVNFADSFRFEPAAYELSLLLGVDNVPPAVRRRVDHRSGTLQIWVYDALMENERSAQRLSPPDRVAWERQRQQMVLFDVLIGNVDRNGGNVLIDGNWKMWLIDHTRAFYARAGFDDLEEIVYLERGLWRRLRSLEREQLRNALGEHLSDSHVDRLLRRRDRIVAHVASIIAGRGEDAVLYDGG